MSIELDATKWNWEEIERDVIQRIHVLRAAATKTEPAEWRDKITADLIVPAMKLLAEFCQCIEIEEAE